MTIQQIKQLNADKGGHYFERSTMRFFRSRVLSGVYEGNGGIYFVTSEQFVGSDGIAAPRQFTVRQFNPDTADIRSASPFNTLSRSQAIAAAKSLANSGAIRTRKVGA